MNANEIRAWMRGDAFGRRGVMDTIVRLVEQEAITRRKAVELIQAWYRLRAGETVADEDLRAPWGAVNWRTETETPCPRCQGCGKVADTPDAEPWSVWASLPLHSSAVLGLVRPVPCPRCGGSGRIGQPSGLAHATRVG